MAMTATPASQGDTRPMAEMNTTPLIDVMLVLLIMFIITIPIQTHSVAIDLPVKADDNSAPLPDPVRNRLTIDAAGMVRWNGAPIDRLTLRRYLGRTLDMPVEPELQFEPAADARYLAVDEVLADIKRSGITKMGFVGNERYSQF